MILMVTIPSLFGRCASTWAERKVQNLSVRLFQTNRTRRRLHIVYNHGRLARASFFASAAFVSCSISFSSLYVRFSSLFYNMLVFTWRCAITMYRGVFRSCYRWIAQMQLLRLEIHDWMVFLGLQGHFSNDNAFPLIAFCVHISQIVAMFGMVKFYSALVPKTLDRIRLLSKLMYDNWYDPTSSECLLFYICFTWE